MMFPDVMRMDLLSKYFYRVSQLCRPCKLSKSLERCSQISRVENRSKNIENPDHLGQLLRFPPYLGSGSPKLTDLDKIRAIRTPRMMSKRNQKTRFLNQLQFMIKQQRLPISRFLSHNYNNCEEIIEDMTENNGDQIMSNQEVLDMVGKNLQGPQRLFAVVSFGGSNNQYKVTTEDLFAYKGQCNAKVGDRIKLEKVLLVGGKDFTIVGMPLLERGLVNVEATLIEKTLTHMSFWQEFWRDPKIKTRFTKETRHPLCVFRINSISVDTSRI